MEVSPREHVENVGSQATILYSNVVSKILKAMISLDNLKGSHFHRRKGLLKCTFPRTRRKLYEKRRIQARLLSNVPTYATLRMIFPRPLCKDQCSCLESRVPCRCVLWKAEAISSHQSPQQVFEQAILKEVSRFRDCYPACGKCQGGLLVQAICFPLHLGIVPVCLSEHVLQYVSSLWSWVITTIIIPPTCSSEVFTQIGRKEAEMGWLIPDY